MHLKAPKTFPRIWLVLRVSWDNFNLSVVVVSKGSLYIAIGVKKIHKCCIVLKPMIDAFVKQQSKISLECQSTRAAVRCVNNF